MLESGPPPDLLVELRADCKKGPLENLCYFQSVVYVVYTLQVRVKKDREVWGVIVGQLRKEVAMLGATPGIDA